MKTIINTFMFVLLGLFSSCQFDPYASQATTNQPRKQDVIGAYQFKEQTISNKAIDKTGQQASIILNADGSYQANDIPNVFGGADAQTYPHISASGKWKIETVGSVDNGWGRAKPHWGVTLTGVDISLTNIGLMGDKPPYQLIITFDDPDLGQVMIFKKREVPNPD